MMVGERRSRVEKPEYVGLMRCDFKERVAGRGINLRSGPVALQYARRDAASHASPGLFGAELLCIEQEHGVNAPGPDRALRGS
jgi:hypothetical protein